MSNLQRAVELAAILSLTANTPEARALAARKRVEASRKIDQAAARLANMRALLALFPSPCPGADEVKR